MPTKYESIRALAFLTDIQRDRQFQSVEGAQALRCCRSAGARPPKKCWSVISTTFNVPVATSLRK